MHYSPHGRKELDTTEQLTHNTHTHTHTLLLPEQPPGSRRDLEERTGITMEIWGIPQETPLL